MHLEAKGYIARGGQIVDATIVSVPRQRNTKKENETIKAGETPQQWQQQPAKLAQKDVDARWTKKNDESFYGYKNHVGIDKAHKLIRKWDITDAAVHDSRTLDDILDPSNTASRLTVSGRRAAHVARHELPPPVIDVDRQGTNASPTFSFSQALIASRQS